MSPNHGCANGSGQAGKQRENLWDQPRNGRVGGSGRAMRMRIKREMPTAVRFTMGFTLVEVMITVAVVAVMASIAAPSMIQFIRSSRLTSVATQFHADLQIARREAIRRNVRVLVCPSATTSCPSTSGAWSSANWASGWLVCYDADSDNSCDSSTSANPNPVRRHGAVDPSSSSINIAATASCNGSASSLSAPLQFNADGTQGTSAAASPTLYFTINGNWSGTKSYCASIAGTGNILLAAPS